MSAGTGALIEQTVAQLTGIGTVADRAQFSPCAAEGGLRDALLSFLELNAYLDDQAIPATS